MNLQSPCSSLTNPSLGNPALIKWDDVIFICNMMDKKQKIWLIQNKWASLAYV